MTPSPITDLPSGVNVTSPAPAAPASTAVGDAPTPAPAFAEGGNVPSSSTGISISALEALFMVIGLTSLFFIIQASRKKIHTEETINNKLSMRVDDLEAELTKLKTKTTPKKNKSGFIVI